MQQRDTLICMDRYGELIRATRTRLGMGSVELAQKLGRHQSFVSRIETGAIKETPQPEVLRAIAAALDLPMSVQLEALGYDCSLPAQAITDPLLVALVKSWPLSAGAAQMIAYLVANETKPQDRESDLDWRAELTG